MPEIATINRTYNDTIKQADNLAKSKDFESAFEQYKKALSIKSDSNHAKERIEKLNRMFEIKKRISEKSASMAYNKAMQLALKTVLNATYGAFANKYFVLSNAKIANAITAMGRDLIRYMIIRSEEYFYNMWHDDIKSHKLLGLEYIAKEKKSDKYVFLNRNYKKIGKSYPFFNTNEPGDILLSLNIHLNNLKKIEPIELDDYFIFYEYNLFDVTEVKKLDEKPIWKFSEDDGVSFYTGKNPISMYGDTDSFYMSYKPIMESVGFEGDALQFILHFDKVIMKELHKSFIDEYAIKFGVENKQDFELETISDSILFFEKKNYLKSVRYDDGVFHEPLTYFSATGIKIVRSETPPFVRGKDQKGGIWDFIKYLFANSVNDNLNIKDILKIVKDIRKEFELEEIDNISSQTSCTNYNDRIINDATNLETVLGAHFGVKAAGFYNYLLNRNSEYKTKYDMIRGGKIKYYYCKHEKNNVFGYLRGMHPNEITEKEGVVFDYDAQFDKSVLMLCNSFLRALDLPPISKRLSVLNSIFDFKLKKNDVIEKNILLEKEGDEEDVFEDF